MFKLFLINLLLFSTVSFGKEIVRTVTDENSKREELISRMAVSNQTANRLKLFWNTADTTLNWKLRVFDAVLRSKLLYGFETMELTEQELNKLNSFQIKGIRRIATAWKGGTKKDITGIAKREPKDPAPMNPPFPIPWRKTEMIATT